MKSDQACPAKGLHWVALSAAAFTWLLLISGGEVTTYKVGMAVPDWPTTFGENMFLYDFWHASMGVFKEHLHRLLGSTLGFATIVLAVWTLRADPRRWMKAVGVGVFVAVCIQGLLGGSRVTRISQPLAAVHACSGQAVFALLVAVAVWTSPSWWKSSPAVTDEGRLRRASLATLVSIYVQIVLGAWVRHFPSTASATVHGMSALVVLASCAWLIGSIERRRQQVTFLLPAARTMGFLLVLQLILGLASLWVVLPLDGIPKPVSSPQAWIRTGHQANGALLFASAVVIFLRAFGRLTTSPAPGLSPSPGKSPATPGLEAVA